jgi:hypothetical protein
MKLLILDQVTYQACNAQMGSISVMYITHPTAFKD